MLKLLKKLFFDKPLSLLSWIGRQGTYAVAAVVVIRIFVQPIGAIFKPHVSEAVFVLLLIAFLRMDTSVLMMYAKRPLIVVAATVWTSFAVPVLFGICCLLMNLKTQSPDLFLGLMLQAITSPMMATPAIAIIMGFDATLVLIAMLISTAMIPLTAPVFVYVFIGEVLTVSPVALGFKLFVIIAGSALAGAILRRFIGIEAIENQKERIDGLNIIVLFIFVAAMMEGVAHRFLAMPKTAIVLALIATAAFVVLFVITVAIFIAAGSKRAFALGFMASQRNMGLMLAATAGALPDTVWLYFALSQFPIYLSPKVFQWIMKRISRRNHKKMFGNLRQGDGG